MSEPRVDTGTVSVDSSTTLAPEKETFEFQAEIGQLMSLLVNTVYSNKDIFLRELISNASDALNKVRLQSLSDTSVLYNESAMEICIVADKEAKTLTIQDTGTGMTKSELVSNLGMIANSGTKTYIEQFAADADMSMIGQFGIGFYSSFLVADKVVVHTKSNDDEQYIWESCASGSFTVSKDTGPAITRGTWIVLYMNVNHAGYLEPNRLKDLVKKFSEFIQYPILLLVEKEVEKEAQEEEDEEHEKEFDANKERDGIYNENEFNGGENETNVVDITETPLGNEKKTKVVKVQDQEWKLLNNNKPIWTLKPDDVTNKQYAAFYQNFTNDWEEHLCVKHFKLEGQLEFQAIIFVPKRAPFDLFEPRKKQNSIKLYVKRVFIMDNCQDIIPPYLDFIKGVVDSEDLPLNLSREMLQQNKVIKVIQKTLVKKCLDLFTELADEKEDYAIFYEQFSKNIKLGIHEDDTNREKLANLLRYNSNKYPNEMISLMEYVERMKDGQKNIYYITGANKKVVQDSPFLETLNKKGFEVLYMVEPIDEYCVQLLKEFDGKKLMCASKEEIDLVKRDDEKLKDEDQKKVSEVLCTVIKEYLGGLVQKVVVSERLLDSPCILVTPDYGWSANMERIMKAQALRDSSQSTYRNSCKIMEINPSNDIMKALQRLVDADATQKKIMDIVVLLYDTAILSSGFSLDDPGMFGARIHRMIKFGLNINDDDEEIIDLTNGGDDVELPPIEEGDAISNIEKLD